jgi:hypothetical protein
MILKSLYSCLIGFKGILYIWFDRPKQRTINLLIDTIRDKEYINCETIRIQETRGLSLYHQILLFTLIKPLVLLLLKQKI